MPVLETDVWLRGEEFDGKDLEVEIVDEGELIAADKTGFGREAFNITVKTPEGEKRTWTVNKTSQRTLATKWSRDTKKWVGKKIVLFSQQQLVGKEQKWVIYARLPK